MFDRSDTCRSFIILSICAVFINFKTIEGYTIYLIILFKRIFLKSFFHDTNNHSVIPQFYKYIFCLLKILAVQFHFILSSIYFSTSYFKLYGLASRMNKSNRILGSVILLQMCRFLSNVFIPGH